MSEAMSKGLPNKDKYPERRMLVLGFDAGCLSCSGLAGRIRQRVGNKLAVRSLGDPEVLRWRRQALGADAPWAPTLFEVKGDKVRAWAGWKMGWALSRALGPAATWQIMQALGEVGSLPEVAAIPAEEGGLPRVTGRAISRHQFLKGAGGAAVAMSVMSGGTLLSPSAARAEEVTTGTEEQRRLAKSIVRNSGQHQSFVSLQSQISSTFDFTNAEIHVYDNKRATVTVKAPATNNDRAVLNGYHVNLTQNTLINYHSLVFCPVEGSPQCKVTYWHNGRLPRLNHQTICGEDYVITYDNRLMSPDQFKSEAEAHSSSHQASLQSASTDPYEVCVLRETNRCSSLASDVCFALGVGATAYGFLISGPAGAALGAGFGVGCYIVGRAGCPGAAQDICRERLAPATVQKPATYYC